MIVKAAAPWALLPDENRRAHKPTNQLKAPSSQQPKTRNGRVRGDQIQLLRPVSTAQWTVAMGGRTDMDGHARARAHTSTSAVTHRGLQGGRLSEKACPRSRWATIPVKRHSGNEKVGKWWRDSCAGWGQVVRPGEPPGPGSDCAHVGTSTWICGPSNTACGCRVTPN